MSDNPGDFCVTCRIVCGFLLLTSAFLLGSVAYWRRRALLAEASLVEADAICEVERAGRLVMGIEANDLIQRERDRVERLTAVGVN